MKLAREIVVIFTLLVTINSDGHSLLPVETSEEEDSGTASTQVNVINADQRDTEEFVPTMEWQEIKPGQSIPKGLHVRINFETGLKEAKILVPESDTNEESIGSNAISPPLEEALKRIASSKDAPGLTQDSNPSVNQKQKWRSMKEIKESFTKQNMTISSEMEIVSSLYERLLKGTQDNDSMLALDDLEFYVHKYDNAVYFSDLGGVVLLKHLINASSQPDIVAKAALTLGSAMQSNAYVARAAIKAGIMPALLGRLRTAVFDTTLSNRLIFAISSLVRADSEGVNDLTAQGGSKIFRSIIAGDEYGLKSKVKVYTLVDDLLTAESEMTPATRKFLLEDDLVKQMCHQLSRLLPLTPQAAQVDKLISFLEASLSLSLCKEHYEELQLSLSALEVGYGQRMKDPDMGEFYQSIVERIKLCSSQMASKTSTKHEEL